MNHFCFKISIEVRRIYYSERFFVKNGVAIAYRRKNVCYLLDNSGSVSTRALCFVDHHWRYVGHWRCFPADVASQQRKRWVTLLTKNICWSGILPSWKFVFAVIQTNNGRPLTEVYDVRELRKLCARIQAQHLLDTSTPLSKLEPLKVKILDRWSISAVLSPHTNLDELIDQVPADWPEFQTKIVKGTKGRKKQVVYCYPLHYRDYNFTESADIDNVVNDFFIAPADSDDNIILVPPHTTLIFYQDPANVDKIRFQGYEDTLKFTPLQTEYTVRYDGGQGRRHISSSRKAETESNNCSCIIV